jgi:hypothetical protein
MTLRQRKRLICFRISTLRITKTRPRATADPFRNVRTSYVVRH